MPLVSRRQLAERWGIGRNHISTYALRRDPPLPRHRVGRVAGLDRRKTATRRAIARSQAGPSMKRGVTVVALPRARPRRH